MNTTSTDDLIEAVAANFLSYRSLRLDLLVSICFLCDWKHLIEFDETITGAQWFIESNRIRSTELEADARKHALIEVETDALESNITPKSTLNNSYPKNSTHKLVCDHVFKVIENQSDFNIQRLVISTFPFNYSGSLDLLRIRNEYIGIFGKEYSFKATA